MVELTDRESLVLESLVKNFIITANPVGSRFLSKKIKKQLSPATIRNVLNDLEEKGFVDQPHTSAGRVPTDKGYRLFVNRFMKRKPLSDSEKKVIEDTFSCFSRDQDLILTRASQVLSEISRQLGIVLSPRFEKGIFKRIELIHLAERRILVIISIASGLVRTITIELNSEIPPNRLELTARILNERLAGLSLAEIRDTIGERMDNAPAGDIGLINLFVASADELFSINEEMSLHLDGAQYMIDLPEFSDIDKMKQMYNLIENKQQVIVHLLNAAGENDSISITIGNENNEKIFRDFSLVATTYRVGDITGVLGVIGPTRMHYAKMVTLVDYISTSISRILSAS